MAQLYFLDAIIASLHNINYKGGGFISNEIYFAAWYPRYKDEILSMNRNNNCEQ